MTSLRSLLHLQPQRWAQHFRVGRRGPGNLSLPAAGQWAAGTSHGWVSPLHTKTTEDEASKTRDQQQTVVSSTSEEDKSWNVFDQLFPPNDYKTSLDQLDAWTLAMRKAQKRGQMVEVRSILDSSSFPSILQQGLHPTSSLRPKVLAILLAQREDEEWTEQALKQTVDNMAQIPLKVVTEVVSLLSASPPTPLRQKVRKDLVLSAVTQRWYEIGPSQLVFFMYELDQLFDMRAICRLRTYQQSSRTAKDADNKGDVGKKEAEAQPNLGSKGSIDPSVGIQLESRAISLVDELKVKDLSRIVSLLGKWRNRNETLLNAALHRLCLSELRDFSFVQLYNLLFACSVLSLHNSDIVGKLCQALEAVPPPTPTLACSMLSSLSHLRWSNPRLVSATLDVVRGRLGDLSKRDLSSLLLSLANLYTVPLEETDAALVRDVLDKALEDCTDRDRVTYTWCATVLQLLQASQAEQVLQPSFVQQFSGNESSTNPLFLQRLCTINLAAQHELQNYEGPVLSEDTLNSFPLPERTAAEKSLHKSFIQAVEKFADLQTYVSVQPSIAGLRHIDAVLVANSEGEVCPLSDVDKDGSYHRLACQAIPFSGVMGSDQTTVGTYQLTRRILQHLGYVPVQILYSDLRPNQTSLEHVNNIRSRVKAAVQGHAESKRES